MTWVVLVTGPTIYGSYDDEPGEWPERIGEHERLRLAMRLIPPGSVVVHGEALGADAWADKVALEEGLYRVKVPYFGPGGKAGGPMRNALMVRIVKSLVTSGHYDRGVVFACGESGRSTGTDDCVHRAEVAGLDVRWIK